MKRKTKRFLRPMRNEKYSTILIISSLCLLLLVFCSVLIFLSTPVKIAGSLECSIKGNITNTDGELKIQELTDIKCSGDFDTEIPLGFIASVGGVK